MVDDDQSNQENSSDDGNEELDQSVPTKKSLLRFISKGLELNTVVAKDGSDIFIQIETNNELIGKRRLGKAKCCRSESPCIGTIPVRLEFQEKYGLPSFVHVSLCYDQITAFFDEQNQTYPRTF